MFPVLFGIPLSLTSLATGLVLGLGSKWGVFRYRWVTAKLLLNLSVILVGAFLIGPTTAALATAATPPGRADPRERLRRGRAPARDRAVGVQAGAAAALGRRVAVEQPLRPQVAAERRSPTHQATAMNALCRSACPSAARAASR